MERTRNLMEIAGIFCVSIGAFLLATWVGFVVTGAGLLGLSWTLGRTSR